MTIAKAKGLPVAKRSYKKPQLKKLGTVKKLTLKIGSNTDSMGGHF